MTQSTDVYAVLKSYPQVYFACHADHRTRKGAPHGLTAREASILAHIEEEGTSPNVLSRHLGVSASTLSASLARLEEHGMIAVGHDPQDGRRRKLALTGKGQAAIAENSVLEPERVEALLRTLNEQERQVAVQGLKLLAMGARRLREKGE